MANPQLEDGYTRTANSLLEAWARASLTSCELRVLLAIVRLSYGWNRKDTGADATYSLLERMAGMGRSSVCRAIRGLLIKQIIRRIGTSGQTSVYEIVKDFDSWSPMVLPETWAPLKVEFSRSTNPAPPEPAQQYQSGTSSGIKVEPLTETQQFYPGTSSSSTLAPLAGSTVEPLIDRSVNADAAQRPAKDRTKRQLKTEQQEQPPNPRAGGRVHESAQEQPQKPEHPKPRKRRTDTPLTDDLMLVYTAYRAHHGRQGITPRQSYRAVAARALEEYPAADLVLVVDWAHESGDQPAAHLRETKYMGLDNILRLEKIPLRLELAQEWDAAGRPSKPPDNGVGKEPDPYDWRDGESKQEWIARMMELDRQAEAAKAQKQGATA